MKAELITASVDIARELTTIGAGLTEEVIRQSVERGYLRRVTCDQFHPKTLPGTLHRAESISSLRHDLVVAWGWSPDCASNQELIISPDGLAAIAVVAGDCNIGSLEKQPSTKYDSGSLTRRAIAVNAGQLEMSFGDPAPVADGHAEARKTWMLLSHIAPGEIRFELSLPVGFGDDNFVDSWRKRIIFSSTVIDGIRVPELPPYAQQPDVDVQLKA
ncbi:MAG TPA: hypothetical protein PK205_15825 [Promineifilum sp.]|nr:hypothetical protein [Promineifilum sp.]